MNDRNGREFQSWFHPGPRVQFPESHFGAEVRFLDNVTQGTGFAYSRYLENRVPRRRDGEFPALLMLKSLLKDFRLVRDLTSDAEANHPSLKTIVKTFEDSVDMNWADDGLSAVMELLEIRIGRTIPK